MNVFVFLPYQQPHKKNFEKVMCQESIKMEKS